MKKTILFLFIVGCSFINRDSNKHYKSKKGMTYQHKSVYRQPPKDDFAYDPNPPRRTLVAGKKLYKESCYFCHGDKGEGDGPWAKNLEKKPADLQQIMEKAPNFQLYLSISKWFGNMPGWKDKNYTEEEILQIGYYIRSLEK